MAKQTYHITPTAGYILTTPYEPDTTFESVRVRPGEALISEILAIGDSVMDDRGNIRTTPYKVGDIIVHAFNNKDFELGFTKYRYCHFTEVYGQVQKKEDKQN